ncbi:hypothetical protein PG999_013926 [Apiospora kogelbergensis]|uniref:Uncharacterized protein n=1 Tax=Apiospora kogelbergensis TaxID=1337665 RepID=A0AAW0Q5X4_9PEZI
MLSPNRVGLDASQKDELLRTDKSLRQRFGDVDPIKNDTSPSKLASDAKKHKKSVTFAPFRVSLGNLTGPKPQDAANQVHKGYTEFDNKKVPTDGFAPYMRGAVNNTTSYMQRLVRNSDSYNGGCIRDTPNNMGIGQLYRQERGYLQDYHSPQLQRPYADPRQFYDSPHESYSTHRPRSPPSSPESPVVTELEKRYGNLRLALHSKVMNGLENVEKELNDEVAASINALFDPIAQLDQHYRRVLLPLSDGETQLSIVSTQENEEDSQRSQNVQISTLATDFEKEEAQAEIELMGKALLEKPPGREDSASSADGRRGKDTNGMKSILDDLLGEFSDDLECTSNEVLEDMRKYEKELREKLNKELGKITGAWFSGTL